MSESKSDEFDAEKPATKRKLKLTELAHQMAAASVASLSTISLNENARPLILFSEDVMEVDSHYLDYPELKGNVQCNGEDCPLCTAGLKKSQRLLLGVYDMQEQCVSVLSMSDKNSSIEL